MALFARQEMLKLLSGKNTACKFLSGRQNPCTLISKKVEAGFIAEL